jgi:hypothetical protein
MKSSYAPAAVAGALSLVCALVVSCGGSGGGGPGGGGDAGGDGPDGGGGGGGGVDAGDLCIGGTLCGSPASCCAAGNECVDGLCLAACDSGVRCGADLGTCCESGNVCLVGECVSPGAECEDSYDCEPGYFCEPTIGACLPQPDPLTCEYSPDFDELTIVPEWSVETDQIISIPVVGNLDGIGAPEVVVNLSQQGGPPTDWPNGNITVLDGATGQEVLPRVPHAPPTSYGSHGRSTIAIGDVDGDAAPDIVYAARPSSGRSLIIAIDRLGNLLWRSHTAADVLYGIQVENGGATLANFDEDPEAEVVFGATLLDNDGLLMWDAGTNGSGGYYGSNQGYQGGISAVADLDGDGAPEIISGRHAWKVVWNPGPPPTATVTPYWAYAGDDGYPAVVDLDADGDPEVVLVANRRVIALNGQSGLLWCGVDPTDLVCQGNAALRTQPLLIPGGATSNRGGPPTVADFDGDGRPEIGVAGGYSYSVYDLNRDGEEVPDPAPAAGALFVKWSQTTQDLSSNATGSSVFDFQGDGAAEVVYADECHMRVYTGADGAVQLDIPNTTGTIHEYPLVVDVDGDGNSEILIVANDTNSAGNCPGVTPRRGLFVYGDANDEWVPTRRVWTQHAYHVSNATSAGNVPLVEENNWEGAGLNNYRQNVQGEGVFNAPDLGVDLAVSLDPCNDGQIELRARVTNLGALGVAAGVEVAFYRGTDDSAPLLGTATTAVALLPGQSTVVPLLVDAPYEGQSYFTVVDGGESSASVSECDESNNTDGIDDIACSTVD